MGWNCWECSKCYRESPKNNTWYYACGDAKAQGFRQLSIHYWVDSDPNRPKEWNPPFEPGPISVFSTLCNLCQDMTVEEYFNHLKIIVRQHDYRHHGGAGGWSSLTYNPRKNIRLSFYECVICRKEVSLDILMDDLHKTHNYLEISCGDGSLTFCPSCRTKTKVKELDSLTLVWKQISDKRWNEAYPGSRQG
jgi:hypothetical protein